MAVFAFFPAADADGIRAGTNPAIHMSMVAVRIRSINRTALFISEASLPFLAIMPAAGRRPAVLSA